MKISDMIAALEEIREEHGDLEVDTYGRYGRLPVMAPMIKYRLILKNRRTRPEFWCEWNGEDRKGEKVCYLN